MTGFVSGIASGLFGAILKLIFGKKDATKTDLAEAKGRAEAQLEQKDATNAELEKTARARTDADADVLREQREGKLDSDPDGAWRD